MIHRPTTVYDHRTRDGYRVRIERDRAGVAALHAAGAALEADELEALAAALLAEAAWRRQADARELSDALDEAVAEDVDGELAEAETIGARARVWRRLRGLTQQQVADLMGHGWDRQRVYRLEQGTPANPGADTVRALAGALEVPVGVLLG